MPQSASVMASAGVVDAVDGRPAVKLVYHCLIFFQF